VLRVIVVRRCVFALYCSARNRGTYGHRAEAIVCGRRISGADDRRSQGVTGRPGREPTHGV